MAEDDLLGEPLALGVRPSCREARGGGAHVHEATHAGPRGGLDGVPRSVDVDGVHRRTGRGAQRRARIHERRRMEHDVAAGHAARQDHHVVEVPVDHRRPGRRETAGVADDRARALTSTRAARSAWIRRPRGTRSRR